MAYSPPGNVPVDPVEMAVMLRQELETLARELNSSVRTVSFVVLHVEPSKPRRGKVYYADGVDWNPGNGEGLYRYDGSAWKYVG